MVPKLRRGVEHEDITCGFVAVSRTWGSLPVERPRALVSQAVASQRT